MTPAIGYPTRAAFTAAYDTVSPRFGTGLNRRVILPLLDPIDLLRRQERLMRGYGLKLQELPVDLPAEPWPIMVLTQKNRTPSRSVGRLAECAREVAKSIAGRP
jgi:hypothetical protein